MSEKRHVMYLMNRGTNKGSRGQSQDDFQIETSDGNQAKYWGSIETLSGRELEIARKHISSARVRVKVFRNSNFDINTKKRWQVVTNTGTRILRIGFVSSVDDLGHEIICLCGEEVE